MIIHCIEKIANVVNPSPSKDLILKLVRKQMKHTVDKRFQGDDKPDYEATYNKICTSLLLAQKNLRNRSIEHQVLRAVLYDGSTHRIMGNQRYLHVLITIC